jgi:regulation of enolase protein 1 (concanavalin A-like superfamily)
MKKLLIFVAILACAGVANALVFTDNFDHVTTDDWARINYQGWYNQQMGSTLGDWSIGSWDGYQSLADPDTGDQHTLLAANYVETYPYGMGESGTPQAWTPGYTGETLNGVLRIVSVGGAWADTLNTGAFLYKNVSGDFVSQVQVVGGDNWYHNLGGLMARADNPLGEGSSENWVCLDYFPVWGVGNHSRNTVNGASTESANAGYPGDTYLQLSRVGTTFYLKTSADGVTYTSLPGLEAGIDRADLGDVQVGIFQANFTNDWLTTMEFDNFSITPEPATIGLLGLGALSLIRRKR